MKSIKIGVELSIEEYNAINKLAQDCEISMSEYLRLLIQGIYIGEQMSKGKKQVEFGGYGYSFKADEMEALFKEVSEKLEKAVIIKPTIGEKRVRYKSIKTREKVA